MKRISVLILLILFLSGCAAPSAPPTHSFTVTVENQSEDSYHGFGLEWYENGILVETRAVMEEEFGYVEPGEKSSLVITRDEPFVGTEYAFRIYLIGTKHAGYAMDEPISITPQDGEELHRVVTGSEEGGWSIS